MGILIEGEGVMNITVLLPAYNEEHGIGHTIEDIRKLPLDCRILVADNYSQDGTAEIIKSYHVDSIMVPKRGKGNAVRAALANIDADYVFMLDSDHTYPASYIPAMLNLLQNDYEVVVGVRSSVDPRAMSRIHKVGNWGLSLLASALHGYWVADLCSGMWGFRGYVANDLDIKSERFTLEAELFSITRERHYRLAEIPIRYDVRKGEAHLRVRDGLEIAKFLITRRFSR